MARYGLLFARMGKGVHGEPVGNAEWMAETLTERSFRYMRLSSRGTGLRGLRE